MSPHPATLEAEDPVPAKSATAQDCVASRLFFDASRGGWVFERGPERLNVLCFTPRPSPRVDEPGPEVNA
jgi:hypothetical protein